MKRMLLGVVLLTSPFVAMCASKSGLTDLSASLSGLRDTCANQASSASSAEADAQFKSVQDLKTAKFKVQMDSQVYGIGHGSRETRDYMLQQMQSAQQNFEAQSDSIAAKGKSDASDVLACVADAEQKGKALYSDFKKRNKHAASAAESLMTAWLANVDEITFDTPNGSSSTAEAWKTAKTRAELDAL
ncbi:MAG: hypothetical protein EPN49_15810 [Rhodanobacter sp.]|nr:MAG: hypothetical protein EPN49_15810 [Rhodanobacter sp.]